LTKGISGAGRIASAYYNTSSFTLDVNLVDNEPHQMALYFLDWDDNRTETISILDANNNKIRPDQTLSNFTGGQYLVWNMQGHVRLQVTVVNGVSAVVSGIFFGAAGPAAPPPTVSITAPSSGATLSNTTTLSANASSMVGIASVQFVLDNTTLGPAITSGPPYTFQWNTFLAGGNGNHTLTAIATDTNSRQSISAPVPVTVTNAAQVNTAAFVAPPDIMTQGNWRGKYGASGAIIAPDSNMPAGLVSMTGATPFKWIDATTDPRALLTVASTPTSVNRIPAAFYNASAFSIEVNFTDTLTHQVALYLLDWDHSVRAETISFLDANNPTKTLSSYPASAFDAGTYLVWTVTGHVIIQVKSTVKASAVVSGLFFDPGK